MQNWHSSHLKLMQCSKSAIIPICCSGLLWYCSTIPFRPKSIFPINHHYKRPNKEKSMLFVLWLFKHEGLIFLVFISLEPILQVLFFCLSMISNLHVYVVCKRETFFFFGICAHLCLTEWDYFLHLEFSSRDTATR